MVSNFEELSKKIMTSSDHVEVAAFNQETFLSKSQVERSSLEINLKDSPLIDQKIQNDDYESIRSTKAKMGEIREENERLKMVLSKIVKEYQSLQVHFFDILKQSDQNKPIEIDTEAPTLEEPHELVMLSLGQNSTSPKKSDEKKELERDHEEINNKSAGGLDLGLELISSSDQSVKNNITNSNSENTCEDFNEEEIWPPSKVLKTTRSGDIDQEVSQQTPLKKARVSVRARCDARTINDGCQWRKYGQKISKGNPCPRAYYRCTASPTCPVRKQVQRCAEDMSILITTYEGTHNHPLPISATAMASTTSAAVSMLQSQSLTSQPASSFAAPLSSSTTTIQGLNFTFPQNTRTNPYFPYNTSISNTNLHSTITLDLTTPPTQPNRFSYINQPNNSLSFSSSSPNMSWNRNQYNVGSLNLGSRDGEQQIRSYQRDNYMSLLKDNSGGQQQQQQQQQTLIAAATKVIASNPNFRSALEAAITSYVGNQNDGGGGGDYVAKENGDRI